MIAEIKRRGFSSVNIVNYVVSYASQNRAVTRRNPPKSYPQGSETPEYRFRNPRI
jgi:hypothetical protein